MNIGDSPGKQLVGGPIRSGNLVFVGGIGGWYPERRPEGPGDVRQQFGDALEMMKKASKRPVRRWLTSSGSKCLSWTPQISYVD